MTFIIVSLIFLGIIVSGILLLKQSAKKFNLSEKQLAEVKKRQAEQAIKDQQDKNS